MRFLYGVMIRLLVPLMLARLLWRSRRDAGYRAALGQRLGWGFEPVSLPRRPIWIHAVSVGETLAIAPLVDALLEDGGGRSILLTSTTPTGAAQVKRLFGDRVHRGWAPFDTPGAVRRFLNRWQPAAVVLVETEIWPEIILQSRGAGIPVLLLNARMSARSARAYARIAPLSRPVIGALSTIACQQASDARRFRVLGACSERISVAGSIKYDLPVARLEQRCAALAAELGLTGDRPVLLAASTHEGEESMVLEAFERVRRGVEDALLILAPRHPERTPEIAGQLAREGWRCQQRSGCSAIDHGTDVFLLDTLGELAAVTGLARAVFVGGSLVPRGGHNPLEAAAFAVPIVTGPNVFNFETTYRDLLRCGGAIRVLDGPTLAESWLRLLQDPHLGERTGVAAREYLERNRGALARQHSLVVAAVDA